jgi:hypothetical protein
MVPHSEPSAKLSMHGSHSIRYSAAGSVESAGTVVSVATDAPPHDATRTLVTNVSMSLRERTA